jgi:hypothetical protein
MKLGIRRCTFGDVGEGVVFRSRKSRNLLIRLGRRDLAGSPCDIKNLAPDRASRQQGPWTATLTRESQFILQETDPVIIVFTP